jgi:hypothetical protein
MSIPSGGSYSKSSDQCRSLGPTPEAQTTTDRMGRKPMVLILFHPAILSVLAVLG